MKKLTFSIALIIYTTAGFVLAAQPAPAEKGLAENTETATKNPLAVTDDPEVAGENAEETTAQKVADTAEDTTSLKAQIAALQTEIKALRTTLDKFADTQKELEQLRGKVVIMEGDNAAIRDRVEKLETEKDELVARVKTLEGDNATLLERMRDFSDKMGNLETEGQKQLTAKPAFVKAAVRFHNHEGRPLKMNVNGVWHTLQEGENTVWVPYAPVHIYRYTGADPRTFWKWKPHMDGYIMEFDVGTP